MSTVYSPSLDVRIENTGDFLCWIALWNMGEGCWWRSIWNSNPGNLQIHQKNPGDSFKIWDGWQVHNISALFPFVNQSTQEEEVVYLHPKKVIMTVNTDMAGVNTLRDSNTITNTFKCKVFKYKSTGKYFKYSFQILFIFKIYYYIGKRKALNHRSESTSRLYA